MSNVLAIASVTHLLKEMLNDALVAWNANAAIGGSFTVTALPPDRVVSEDPTAQDAQLNLFLHRVTPNAALRNADLPTRGADGTLKCRPRLALDLHYILTALAAEELHAEILLGHAMQFFNEMTILPREQVRQLLQGGIGGIPPAPDLPHPAELADQIELLKITPHTLSMDDTSKMWTALQASYRTTVAYDVSLVLIEREVPVQPALPVLSRGGPVDPMTDRDPGILLRPGLGTTSPTLVSIEPADGQQVMRLGGDVQIFGLALSGGETVVRFSSAATGEIREMVPIDPVGADKLTIRLPDGPPLTVADPRAGTAYDPGTWRIGPYIVDVRVTDRDGRAQISNALAVILAPRITPSAATVPGGIEISMSCSPRIRPGQSVAIVLGREMTVQEAPVAAIDSVSQIYTDLVSNSRHPVRLRIDGIDSPVIDKQATPPVLQSVTIP